MKTVIVKLSGEPEPGDLVMVWYGHPVRGGVSAIKYRVNQPRDRIELDRRTGKKSVVTDRDTISTIVQALVDEVSVGGAFYGGGFQARRREGADDTFVIQCNDEVHDVVFKSAVEGTGTVKVNIEVMG